MKLTHYYGNHYTRNKPNSYSLIVKAVIFFLVILHLALGIYLKLWKLTLSIAYTAPITLEAQNTAQMRALRRLVSIMWFGNTLHILFVDIFFVFLNIIISYEIQVNWVGWLVWTFPDVYVRTISNMDRVRLWQTLIVSQRGPAPRWGGWSPLPPPSCTGPRRMRRWLQRPRPRAPGSCSRGCCRGGRGGRTPWSPPPGPGTRPWWPHRRRRWAGRPLTRMTPDWTHGSGGPRPEHCNGSSRSDQWMTSTSELLKPQE